MLEKVVCSWVELRRALLGDLFDVRVRPCCLLGSKDVSDVLCEHFSQFDSPLIKAINAKEESFYSNSVLIHREELSAFVSCQRAEEKQAQTGSVTNKELVLLKRLRHALCFELLISLAQGKCIRLSEEIRHELIMIGDCLPRKCHWGL